MCEPTAQDYFSRDREDDPAIGDADRLLRSCRLPVQIVPNKAGGYKISDQVFRKKPNEQGASVDLECLLLKEGKTFEDRFGKMPGTLAMAAIAAEDVRRVNGGVAWTPKPEEPHLAPDLAAEENPYHGEIIGEISRADGRALSRKAAILKSIL